MFEIATATDDLGAVREALEKQGYSFLEAEEAVMLEFFGERGERGVILKEGLFNEEQVQRAYLECIRKGDTYENKRYEPLQGKGQGGSRCIQP